MIVSEADDLSSSSTRSPGEAPTTLCTQKSLFAPVPPDKDRQACLASQVSHSLPSAGQTRASSPLISRTSPFLIILLQIHDILTMIFNVPDSCQKLTHRNMILTVILLCNVHRDDVLTRIHNIGVNMQFATLILFIFLMAANNNFEGFLSTRDFDSALESAGNSDSLKAVVSLKTGNYSMAAMLFEKAFEESPSAGLFAALWESIASSTEYYSSMSAACLREQIEEWDNVLSWRPDNLVSLIETSSALEDSLLTDSLMQVLVEGFSESLEASEVIGWEFFDSLYPVWSFYNFSISG